METDIEIGNLMREPELRYTCKACGYRSSTSEDLNLHRKKTHGLLTPIGRSSLASSIASLALRGFLGTVMVMHGIPKVAEKKDETTERMDTVGVPKSATVFSSLLEVAGGASLLLGFMVPVVSSLFVTEMIGTALISKEKMGKQFLSGGERPSYELNVIYAITFGTLAVIGGGDFSLDRLFGL